jgi:hypothetical protein
MYINFQTHDGRVTSNALLELFLKRERIPYCGRVDKKALRPTILVLVQQKLYSYEDGDDNMAATKLLHKIFVCRIFIS